MILFHVCIFLLYFYGFTIVNITNNGNKSDKEFPTQNCYDYLSLGKEEIKD